VVEDHGKEVEVDKGDGGGEVNNTAEDFHCYFIVFMWNGGHNNIQHMDIIVMFGDIETRYRLRCWIIIIS